MSRSVYHALRSLEPELSDSLVDGGARAALLQLATQLPEVGGSQYLECRLGAEPSTQVDLLVAISRSQRRPNPSHAHRSPCALAPLRRLLEHWGRRGSLAYDIVPVIWAEFDDVTTQKPARANVCACIVPSYKDPMAPLTSLPLDVQHAVLGELVGAIRGTPCSPSERAQLERCVELLPAGAHWIHLSVMTERAPAEIKLYGCFPRSSVLGYLSALGWPGDEREVALLLERYFPMERTAGYLYVDLPVTRVLERHEPILGLCLTPQHLAAAQERDPSRLPLLQLLTDDALCSPAQARALAAWPSVAAGRSASRSQVERWFDVKIVTRPAAPVLAKAYLGFSSPAVGHHW